MITKEYVEENALSPTEYFDSISDKYLNKWQKKLDQVKFDEDQLELLNSQFIPIHIVVFSGEWCPDSQAAVPIVIKMAEISDNIYTYILERDDHKEQMEDYRLNGGLRIPFILFTNQEFEELGRWVERSTLAYELVLSAKKKAIRKSTDDYGEILRENFKDYSDEMFQENIKELFFVLEKAILIRNSAANLEELTPQIAV